MAAEPVQALEPQSETAREPEDAVTLYEKWTDFSSTYARLRFAIRNLGGIAAVLEPCLDAAELVLMDDNPSAEVKRWMTIGTGYAMFRAILRQASQLGRGLEVIADDYERVNT